MIEKVYVGMSGGVDSSIAAYLLKNKGYKVSGITMLLHDYSLSDEIGDAKKVCEFLDIPHIVLDLRDKFKTCVIDRFIEEYKSANTPNPCILCNKALKWGAILDEIDRLGGGFLATGHYSQIEQTKNDRWTIRCPRDNSKDQSYVLYTLSQKQLSRTLMPLGNYTKEDIRAIAKDIGLFVSEKKDSQDICFIPDGDYKGFIQKHADISDLGKGYFIDTKGNVLGEHSGIYNYTIGQRKNLGIALGKRMYVKYIDIQKNTVTLCDDEELYIDTVYAKNINHMSEERFREDKTYRAKIRYSQDFSNCKISYTDKGIKAVFERPQRAPAKGQSLVLYDGDYVAGGGIIYVP